MYESQNKKPCNITMLGIGKGDVPESLSLYSCVPVHSDEIIYLEELLSQPYVYF